MALHQCTPGDWAFIKITEFPFGCKIVAGDKTIMQDHAVCFGTGQESREDCEAGKGFTGADLIDARNAIAEQDANFRMMAASKEMLKALRPFAEYIKNPSQPIHAVIRPEEWDAVIAAVAKAEGK